MGDVDLFDDAGVSTAPSEEGQHASDNVPIVVTENALEQYAQILKDPNLSASFRVYKRRWFLLLIIVLINFTNALIWIMFSPVTDLTSKYFNISPMAVNWLSLVYLIASIPCGFFASWMLDTLGLRASIICAAFLNFVGSAVRNLTIFDFLSGSGQYPVLLLGQTIAACGQTFIMFTPAKVAALWFSENQRAIATSLASMANPLGILAANILSPAVVKQDNDLPILIWLCSGISLLGVLLSTFGVCSSIPPSPPSFSASAQSEPFFIGIKKLRKNWSFWILAFSMGGGLALFTAYTTFLEQILCPRNYTNSFAGICGALMIGAGIVGALIAGVIADKTRKFAEVTKAGFIVSCMFCIAFVQLARYRDLEVWVALSVALFGFFGFAIYPTALELAVEVTYPVAEATSTGILFLSGQIQGIVLMLVSQYIAQPLSSHDASLQMSCPKESDFEPQEWTIPNLIGNGMCVIYTIAITLFFRANYWRMRAEDQIKASKVLQNHLQIPAGE